MFKISYDKKITMVQGDTGVIRMRIHNYELSQGDEVRFAIVNKANPSILLCQHSDKKIVLEKQVTVFEKDGSARIMLYPYDTEYLQPGKYLYEIQVKTKDGRIDTVVPLTNFTMMDGSIQGEYGQTTPSKPEPTPSEIELRFKRLENEIIPELGNRITNVENEIDSVCSSLDNMSNLIEINNNKTTKMIAHRGLSSKAPENTIPAIIEASKNGYWGVEFDVAETKDKNFVLMHDDTVDRTTNGVGYVKDKTVIDIKRLTIDSGANIAGYPNLRVPTLDEAIQCCRTYNLVPVIEVKWLYDYNTFINKINDLKIQDEAIFICFSKSVTEYIRKFYPNAKIQQLYTEESFNIAEIEYLKENKFALDCSHMTVTTDLIAVCLDNDIEVNCWTVNNQERANYLISNNVDYITTDECINENSFEYKIANKNSNVNYLPYGNILFTGRSGDPDAVFDNMWNNPNPKRAVSLDKIYIPSDVDNITIEKHDYLKITLNFFNNERKLITDIGWVNNGYVEIPYGAVFCVPYWAKVDETDFSDSDVELLRQSAIRFNRKCYNFEIKEVLNRQAFGEGSKYIQQFQTFSLGRVINKNKLYIPAGVSEITLGIPANFKCSVIPYSKEHVRISDLGWVEANNTKISLPNGTAYILLYWAKINGTEFTIDETYSCKETKILY